MDAAQIYSFLFESYLGVGVLMAAAFVIMLLAALILERRTRRKYVDRGERTDGFSFFADDESDADSGDDAARNGETTTGETA